MRPQHPTATSATSGSQTERLPGESLRRVCKCTCEPCVSLTCVGVRNRGGAYLAASDTQLPARSFAFSRGKERRARERSFLPVTAIGYFWRSDLGQGEKRVVRARSESRSRKGLYDLLETATRTICAYVFTRGQRVDTRGDRFVFLLESGRYNGCFRGSDGRPVSDFGRRRCVGGLPKVTERETWTASPSTSSR